MITDNIEWDSIYESQKFISNWAINNFPGRTAHQALSKLVLEEIPEMLREVKERERQGEAVDRRKLELEYADALILLFDLATLWKIDIPRALRAKMEVNTHRMWRREDSGLYSHVTAKETAIARSKATCPIENCVDNCEEGKPYCHYHMGGR